MIVRLSDAAWVKSSYSGGDGDCVETAWLDGNHIGVRDSKDPAGPVLRFGPAAWDAFTVGVRAGTFPNPLH